VLEVKHVGFFNFSKNYQLAKVKDL